MTQRKNNRQIDYSLRFILRVLYRKYPTFSFQESQTKAKLVFAFEKQEKKKSLTSNFKIAKNFESGRQVEL
jgi:hypothetical protein